jgi:signal-transduction protein with cAMP-binding, CBS, and nucleotidyltransferase domain
MGVLSKGSIFGHFEIIAKSKIRMNRISAIEDTIVLYLAESHFKE